MICVALTTRMKRCNIRTSIRKFSSRPILIIEQSFERVAERLLSLRAKSNKRSGTLYTQVSRPNSLVPLGTVYQKRPLANSEACIVVPARLDLS